MKSLSYDGETFCYIDSLKNELKIDKFEYKYRRLIDCLLTMNQTIQIANLLIDNEERSGLYEKINKLREGNIKLIETISS